MTDGIIRRSMALIIIMVDAIPLAHTTELEQGLAVQSLQRVGKKSILTVIAATRLPI